MNYINGFKINFIFIINLFLILFFESIYCIIEIPIGIMSMKTFFEDNNSIINDKLTPRYNPPKIFMEEGVTKINSQHLFLANIKIGSNSQIFRLILDTGSSLTWVADAQSQIEGLTEASNRFDPNSSSSCIKLYRPFDIKYGTGSCSGFYYIDTIKYINNKEFQLKFGVAKTAKFDFSQADGIIGLSRMNNDKTSSFISMLYESKIIDSKLFSFKFASNNLHLPMGKFFIGKHSDFSKKNSFSCDLLDNNFQNYYYWTCELKSFLLQNSAYTLSTNHTISIIFDTGTNFIFLPYEYLKEMEKDLPKIGCKIIEYEEKQEKSYNQDQPTYRLVCNSNNLPQFQFILGNTTFTIPSSLTFYFNGYLAYSYVLFVIRNHESNPYIFGSPFFMSFHTLFNDEEKKLQFFPLDNSYIVKKKSYFIIRHIIAILTLIVLCGILIYITYLYVKWKKGKLLNEEYQSIIPNDINIEMSNK